MSEAKFEKLEFVEKSAEEMIERSRSFYREMNLSDAPPENAPLSDTLPEDASLMANLPVEDSAVEESPPAAPLPRPLPTTLAERYVSLDVLRGFALLGILIMNIQSFSMIAAAYANPTAYGDLTGINKWVWIISHIFADQKFMTLFSVMFGAGIVLMADRIEARGNRPARVHYRRTFFLILIGLLHAHLFWYGDILYHYGMCALTMYLLRKLSPKWLVAIGLTSILFSSLITIFFNILFGVFAFLPEVQQQAMAGWHPSAEEIAKEVAAYQGGWLQQAGYRSILSLQLETFIFLLMISWRIGGLMLIGMALYKWKVLLAQRSYQLYATLCLVGYGIGVPIVAYGVYRNFQADWSLEYSMAMGSQFNYWGSLLVSLGHLGAIMLICKSGIWQWFQRAMAAVGRMAFTNYLMHTIICTSLFYGHGLGLYGHVERYVQISIVFGVWIFQIYFSQIWLQYFRMGPLEWVWRSVTYWKFPPFRRAVEPL